MQKPSYVPATVALRLTALGVGVVALLLAVTTWETSISAADPPIPRHDNPLASIRLIGLPRHVRQLRNAPVFLRVQNTSGRALALDAAVDRASWAVEVIGEDGCSRGADGFRCVCGYGTPAPVLVPPGSHRAIRANVGSKILSGLERYGCLRHPGIWRVRLRLMLDLRNERGDPVDGECCMPLYVIDNR